jgi:hypothetical protein
MKTLVFKLLLLALPLALLSAGLELGLRKMPNSYNRKRDLLEPRLPRLRVLVLGASQENQGIEADLLDPQGFNLACVGQDYYYDRRLALDYLDRSPQLRLVVLTLSYPSLSYRMTNSPEAWRGFSYRLYYGIPNEDPAARWDIRNFSALAFTGPLEAFGDALAGFKGDASVSFGDDGQQRVPPLSDEVREFVVSDLAARKRIRYLATTMREDAIDGNLGILADLLDALDRRGVPAVFVTSPVTDAYRRSMDAGTWERERARALELFKRRRVDYYDHLGDPRFGDADFSDVDHLNVDGAHKFSSILGREIAARHPRNPS